MAVSLSKTERVHKINLRKEAVDNIVKKSVSLSKLTSKVALALDYSSSMSERYKSGQVQDFVERIVPLALRFDDNGELDSWLFESRFFRLEGVTMENFYGYVEDEIIKKHSMGATDYSPILNDVYKKYVLEEPSDIPSYLIFLTDGENWDKDRTTEVMHKFVGKKLYVQFIGIGNEDYSFLKDLAKTFPHANFLPLADLDSMEDNDLYDTILSNYRQFIEHLGDEDYCAPKVEAPAEVESHTDEKKSVGFFGMIKNIFG